MTGDPSARPDPFLLAFGPFVPERFDAIRAALADLGIDPFDRDAWTLSRPGTELLHDLRPDGGLGEAVTELVALAHAGFLYWLLGEHRIELSRPLLDVLRRAPGTSSAAPRRTAYHLRLPPHRVWGTPVEGQPPEPLDGWFAVAHADRLHVVAIFGLLPGRPGFTVAHAEGPPPGPLARPDGSDLFESVLPGGAEAGLWSLVGHEELLELAWRAHRGVEAPPGGGEVLTR